MVSRIYHSSIDKQIYLSVKAGLTNVVSAKMEVGFLIRTVMVLQGQVKPHEGRLGLVFWGLELSQCLCCTTI